MLNRILILIALVATCYSSIGQDKFVYSRDFKLILAKTKEPSGELNYDKLLKRFQANDSTMTRPQILALLIGFTDKPAYKPYNILETERLIYQLNDEGKFQQAHDTAKLLLKTYPLSYQALKELSYSFSKMGKADSATYYLDLVAKIMSAMLYSGDGLDYETAMFALGPSDGQHLIAGAGLKTGSMGSGFDKDHNFIDLINVITKDGRKIEMHFNIQHAAAKMFDGKSSEEYFKEQMKE